MTRDEAVAYTVKLLGEVFKQEVPRDEVRRKMVRFRAYQAGFEGGVVRIEIKDLIEDAKTDKIAFDALGLVASELVGAGRELDWPLKRWAMGVLRGDISRPSRQGGFKGETFYSDIAIRNVIVEVAKLGFHPTRGEQTSTNDSACDIVAAAMVKMRKRPQSYAHIKDIFDMVTLKGI